MQGEYSQALAALNKEQRRAVMQVDGAVLVIAGPGTGKTQLLTTRIAHILATTDTAPENILCLTFTDSAAATMRGRLAQMIGRAAYDVTISTYHAFGSELIARFPDFFASSSELRPIDDLGIDSLLREIISALPYDNPLKYSELYLGDLKTFISDAKRALLTPANLRHVANDNDLFLESASPIVQQTLAHLKRVDKTAVALFEQIAREVKHLPAAKQSGAIVPLEVLFSQSLDEALEAARETGKTTPLTAWKNTWLAKNTAGEFVVDEQRTNQKLRAAAEIYETYLQKLAARGMFDYDDMILRAIQALQTHADLRYTLQERYLYLLLDEFQDTNGAQLRLVELLTDNPANEGRPNVLAVGDDDQAIFAFQGADYSHMLRFQQMYRDVLVVPLVQNYRSHAAILQTAQGIAEQIEERLHHHFPTIQKTLVAANQSLPTQAIIERREAASDVAQFAWTAQKIQQLIAGGVPANEIAVVAPQHKYLEPLLAFLHDQNIPVRYEKRENVLDDPVVNQLIRMGELVLALAAGNQPAADSLWAEVLSFDFWDVPTSLIWQLSWQASDDDQSWTDTLLANDNLKTTALFFVRLGMLAKSETLETVLDVLMGTQPLELGEPGLAPFTSPFYAHYFKPHGQTFAEPAAWWQLLSNLTVLRARLRDYRAGDSEPLHIQDFIDFVSAHRDANIKILNTSPYNEADDAVQLMTAYKAKGQEFDTVFVLATNDEAWGGKAHGQTARLSLPQNLQFIRYGGATDNERRRLLYVALTRAKTQLFLVNYLNTFAGKRQTRLRYLNETTDETGAIISPLLPLGHQKVLPIDTKTTVTTELASYWQQRHESAFSRGDLKQLLQARLERFQISPTHVGDFTDVASCGPQTFFLNTILRFPRAPRPEMQFGSVVHETLEWLHIMNSTLGKLPELSKTLQHFEDHLRRKRLSEQQTSQLLRRGKRALTTYLAQRGTSFRPDNEVEYNFRNENVFVGQAHLSGKIDKLIIDRTSKTIQIVDYKTGKSHIRWSREVRLHKYRQQLYLYKLLVERSRSFKNYEVTDAYLEFVEPDEDGVIQDLLVQFDATEYERIQLLVQAVWQCVRNVNLPDVSGYPENIAGIEAFENDLLNAKHKERP